MKASSVPPPKIPMIFLCMGIFLLAILTLIPNAATAIWMIRWYPLHLASILLISLGAGMWAFSKNLPEHLPNKLVGMLLCSLSLGIVTGAFFGPFPVRALLYSFPLLAAIFIGCCFLCVGNKQTLTLLVSGKGFQTGLAGFLILFCAVSLYRFVTQDILPFLTLADSLDAAVGGGVKNLLLKEELPKFRNSAPLGHANYTSGFLLLSLPLLLHGIRKPAGKGLRILSIFAFSLGLVVLLSTQSRNAFLGLAFGGCCYGWWLKANARISWKRLTGFALLFLLVMFVIPRFQDGLFTISGSRLGMWKVAMLTGLHYFPFGSGEGLTPEMLQFFSPQLESVWENSMQFHQTWLHLWAVGGVLAVVGILGITIWTAWNILMPNTLDRDLKTLAGPSVMALSAGFVVFMADYQLDIYQMGIFLFFNVSLLSACLLDPNPESTPNVPKAWTYLTLPLVALFISISQLPASVTSRRLIDDAGWAYEQHKSQAAVDSYLQAFESVPEPYALNMAGVVLSQSHQTHPQSIEVFKKSLELWEAQTLVHEYLTYLYMHEAEETADALGQNTYLEKALHHARRRAELSPQLVGSFLDIAMILQRLDASDDRIVDALLQELLQHGNLLFPGVWEVLGELSSFRDPVWEKLMTTNADASSPLQNRIEMCQAWLVRMDLAPQEGGVSEEISQRLDTQWNRVESLKLLSNACEAPIDQNVEQLHRFLVFLYRQPVRYSTAEALWTETQAKGGDGMAELLKAGTARAPRRNLAGVGITSRHPYSIPVRRPRSYPTIFGADIYPVGPGKFYKSEDW